MKSYAVHICGTDTRIRDEAATGCCDYRQHTPGQPAGYVEWFGWAEPMTHTHEQVRCPGCGRFAVWEPGASRTVADDSQRREVIGD